MQKRLKKMNKIEYGPIVDKTGTLTRGETISRKK
jgi:cation transport ATPase